MALPIVGIIAGSLIGGAASVLSFGPGVGDFITRTMNQTFQQRIATAVDLINAYRRGEINRSRMNDLLNENGFDNEQIEILLSSTKTPINISEILTLWFRYRDNPGNEFGVSRNWLENRFKAIGVDNSRMNEFIEANRPVPNLDDIIRFAVRDVFEPEAVRLGNLDAELPQVFLEEAGKRGFAKQDTLNVWRAHWLFPSINQMFEMFHRLFDHPNPNIRFTRQEMNTAFTVADIAPGMRDRLQAIAFQPVGRVDIRRFARMGVYGTGDERKTKLKRAYQELGYSPETAEQQTEFTIRLVDRQSAIFSTAQILKNFREGIPKEDTEKFAREQLTQRGLSKEEIDTLIKLEREKLISVEKQVKIDQIREDFVEGRIGSENALRDRLNSLELSTGQVRELFSDITREQQRKLRRPSTSQADSMLQAGIIRDTEWNEIYSFHGFNRKDRENLLTLVKREQSNVQRLPSKDDVIQFWQNGIISQEEFRSLMNEIGFASRFVDMYILNTGGTV